jgi:hypothetical protein
VNVRREGEMGVSMVGRQKRCGENPGDVAEEVVLGVDTHLDVHVAVALDGLGRHLGELAVPTTEKGYESLICWAAGFGRVRGAGVEGTSSYGAGLARYLRAVGIRVLEVERPKRRHLRRKGKSDSRDAEAAARTMLAGETAGEPKSGDGRVEMIRVLRAARRSAVKARTVWWAGLILTAVGVVSSPIAMALAILRYRLYQIDMIINRTLVYGPLTATLVVLYAVGIVVLQRHFDFVTGEKSTLAVVASTLLIAALITPLRRRIQSLIDRRFYRKKYDARKTLEAFSAKLRDETDLEALNSELVGVVRETTIQPAHVSFVVASRSGTEKGER